MSYLQSQNFFLYSYSKTLYYHFFYPYLDYCIEVWSNAFPTYITPVNRLQNRAIRIILGCNNRTHFQPLYAWYIHVQCANIYVKRSHCLLPDIFNSFFCKNVDLTGHETRQSENLRVPEGVIGIRRRTIRFSGVTLNKFFHNKISYKYSVNSYKFQLKEYLLSSSSLPLIPKKQCIEYMHTLSSYKGYGYFSVKCFVDAFISFNDFIYLFLLSLFW